MSGTLNNLTSAIPQVAGDRLIMAQSDGFTHGVDPSGVAIIASGATTALSLSQRAGLQFFLEDFGVVHDPNGTNVAANTQKYQSALDAVAASSGLAALVHRRGTTVYHTGLTAPSGTILQLDGAMYLATSATQGQVLIVGSDYAIFSSGKTGVIDQQNVVPANYGGAGIWSPNDYAGGSPTTGNPAQSNGYIFGLEIRNCKNWPVSIANTAQVLVAECYMHDCGNSPQFVGGCSYGEFRNNRFANIPDYCPAFYQGGSFLKMVGNKTYNCTTAGALNDGATPYNFSCLTIEDNEFVNSTGQAIILNCPAGGTLNVASVRRNLCINPSLATGNTGAAIYLGVGNSVDIDDNTIMGGGSGAAGENAITIDYGAAGGTQVRINNNKIFNWNSTGKGSSALGVFVAGQTITGLSITKNKITDNQTPLTIATGINVASVGAGLIVKDNELTPTIATPYVLTPASDTAFEYFSTIGKVSGSTNILDSRVVYTGFDYTGAGGTLDVSGKFGMVVIQGGGATISSITLSFPILPAALSMYPIIVVTDSPVTSLSWTFPAGTANYGGALPTSLAAGDQLTIYWSGLISQWIKAVPV